MGNNVQQITLNQVLQAAPNFSKVVLKEPTHKKTLEESFNEDPIGTAKEVARLEVEMSLQLEALKEPEPKKKRKGVVTHKTTVVEEPTPKKKPSGKSAYGQLSDLKILEIPNIVEPMLDHKVEGDRMLSYGLEPHGYTFRLGDSFAYFSPKGESKIVDPKTPNQHVRVSSKGASFEIGPHGSVVAVSVERFNLPENVCALAWPKSSYSRNGIIISFAPIEAGYSGYLTFSIYNSNRSKCVVYPGEGVAQIQFFRPFAYCKSLYVGKYQGSEGLYV